MLNDYEKKICNRLIKFCKVDPKTRGTSIEISFGDIPTIVIVSDTAAMCRNIAQDYIAITQLKTLEEKHIQEPEDVYNIFSKKQTMKILLNYFIFHHKLSATENEYFDKPSFQTIKNTIADCDISVHNTSELIGFLTGFYIARSTLLTSGKPSYMHLKRWDEDDTPSPAPSGDTKTEAEVK